MRFKLLSAFFFSLCLIHKTIYAPITHASPQKFSTAYDVTYRISPTGNATVTENIQLTNLTTDFFASEFILKLRDKHIYNLQAFDNKGSIPVSSKSDGNTTALNFKFNSPIAGKGKTLNWTLTYETAEVAHKVGNIWEIFIPPQDYDESISRYTIGLYVPPDFGSPLYQKPPPNLGSKIWAIAPHKNSGISVAYQLFANNSEPHQSFDAVLKYHLVNKGFVSSTQQITLPPDTSYQKVFLQKITPVPDNVKVDADGNWLASYVIPPRSKLDIIANVGFLLLLKPNNTQAFNPDPAMNLRPTLFWQSNEKQIQKLANKLKTPQAIYNFVVETLTYDKTRVLDQKTRLGAVSSLAKPTSAICMEFTDLFIALSRAAGIPAREIDGFAYTKDQSFQPDFLRTNLLHSWPQYYDTGSASWRMVDPTWEKTTRGVDYFEIFDLDHLAFAIHGQNSAFPPPVGANLNGPNSNDIQITPSKQPHDPNPTQSPVIDFHLNSPLVPPFPSLATITVRNLGPSSLSGQEIEIRSNFELSRNTISLPYLPPFGSFTTQITVQPQSLTQLVVGTVSISLSGKRAQFPIQSTPFYAFLPFQALFTLIITVLVVLLLKRIKQ